MAAYMILIREKLRNQAALSRYSSAAGETLKGHDVKALAFLGASETLEGATADAVVLLAFPDMAAAKAWYDSPAYSAAREHRFQGADYRVILVEGVD